MTKKIVAIGGGGCGNKKADGTISAYDNQAIDEEIIKLTGKEKPNFLFLAHASVGQWQDSYYVLMKRVNYHFLFLLYHLSNLIAIVSKKDTDKHAFLEN